MNIGIPISFSFGPSENKKLYNRHFDTFSKTFGIDLATFPFESDQGSAIISIFEEKNINYFICLRHLLKSLTYNEFSYDISNILKCCSKEDLQNSFLTYSELFGCVIEPEKKILRDKILKKVGLIFEDNSIIIKDEKLWKKVSLFERMPFKMPSTTNSLESMHGQLNHNVPRHNNFWNAIYKLANHFMMKTHTTQDHIKHNYLFEKRQTIAHSLRISLRIEDEIVKYKTSPGSCNCSWNKLLSSIYGVDIPCCHRIYQGESFPQIPVVKYLFEPDTVELVDNYNILIQDENESQIDIDTLDKKYIIKIIKQFSKYKDVEKITNFVDQNFIIEKDEIYINDYPSSFLRIIHNGIEYFDELRKSEKKSQILSKS